MPTPNSAAMIPASVVLPKPGRPVEQHVIHRLAALLRRLDGDGEIFLDLRLPREIGEPARAAARLRTASPLRAAKLKRSPVLA